MNNIAKRCRFNYILRKEQGISPAFFPSCFFIHLICIVDDLNPKRNWKLRPTQCKAVIDANLAFFLGAAPTVHRAPCTHCTHCVVSAL